MVNSRQAVRAILFGLMLPIFSLAPVGRAFGQDFTLTPSALTPAQVDGGVSATATINVQPAAAMTAPTVALSCTVAPVETDGPVCQPSSSSVVAPATAGLTVTTSGTTPEVLYTITFTGTDASGSRSVTFDLGVVAAIGDFALTITSPLSPSSVPAGSGATGTITLTPLNGYNGHMITLACSSVTPPVIPSPQCSFSPTPVLISSGATTAMITVTTAGPNSTTTQLGRPRIFFAAWLLIPSVLLAGLGSAGARRRKLLGGLLLLTLAASLLLIPACGGSTTTNPPTSVGGITGTTPNNTYTFTVTGADENGLVPSTPPTVSLTVTGG
jgi:hypothetical protein